MTAQNQVCLIVDDSESDRRKMRRVMSSACPNVPVLIARSVQEAMERLENRDVAIMFLENDLPDGTGLNMALSLLKDKAHKSMPIILFGDNPTPYMFAKAEAAANVREVWRKSQFSAPGVQQALGQHTRLT